MRDQIIFVALHAAFALAYLGGMAGVAFEWRPRTAVLVFGPFLLMLLILVVVAR